MKSKYVSIYLSSFYSNFNWTSKNLSLDLQEAQLSKDDAYEIYPVDLFAIVINWTGPWFCGLMSKLDLLWGLTRDLTRKLIFYPRRQSMFETR